MFPHHHLLLQFLPFAFAAMALEVGWYRLVQRRAYPWRETLVSFGVYGLHIPARLLSIAVVGPIAWFVWMHRLWTVPLGTSWGLALLFLGEEFAYYWMHRGGHEVRLMWASHVVHHTPEHIHLASSFRLGATELLSGSWAFYLPLYWLGFNPLAVGGMLAANLLYQFWLHTEMVGRLGPLEWVLNTPAHHRVHHASNTAYLDRNYGGILIVFDRLFGTFAREEPETPVVYGLVHPIGSANPLRVAFNEWAVMARDIARTRSWRGRLRQVFGRPGEEPAAPAEEIPYGARGNRV